VAPCWTHSRLYANHGVTFAGNISNVMCTIVHGEEQDDSGDLTIQVDWDELKTPSRLDRLLASTSVTDLLTSIRDAVSIWCNISQDVVCYNADMTAPNQPFARKGSEMSAETERRGLCMEDADTKTCDTKMKTEGSCWPSLCCNEEMNLIITFAAARRSMAAIGAL
jgi:hypothetical protein